MTLYQLQLLRTSHGKKYFRAFNLQDSDECFNVSRNWPEEREKNSKTCQDDHVTSIGFKFEFNAVHSPNSNHQLAMTGLRFRCICDPAGVHLKSYPFISRCESSQINLSKTSFLSVSSYTDLCFFFSAGINYFFNLRFYVTVNLCMLTPYLIHKSLRTFFFFAVLPSLNVP